VRSFHHLSPNIFGHHFFEKLLSAFLLSSFWRAEQPLPPHHRPACTKAAVRPAASKAAAPKAAAKPKAAAADSGDAAELTAQLSKLTVTIERLETQNNFYCL